METHALKRTVQDKSKTVQRSIAALVAKQEQLQGLVSQIGSLRDATQVRVMPACMYTGHRQAGI